MSQAIIVFGGTGFLGRRIVRALRDRGVLVRVATRHPDSGTAGAVRADIEDERSVAEALRGCGGVVNAVSLYVEQGSRTFQSIHVDAAARLARLAQAAGLRQLVHISGIGANPESTSPYIRSRGRGEREVTAAFPAATIMRPSAMFGPDDALLSVIAALVRRSPVFALFGQGRTLMQPAYVEDVAQAVAEHLTTRPAPAMYELGGPDVLTYRSLVEKIASGVRRNPVLLPVPFALWRVVAAVAELLPDAPITRNQVELMQIDNVASDRLPGFGALGIAPRSIDDILPHVVGA
jgi:uncharacterized protein YbjT (DUF2867 family)